MSENPIALELGRLLRSGTSGCVVGVRVTDMSIPQFGGMVRIPLGDAGDIDIYGLIHDIRVEDDGLVRQLITAEHVDDSVIQDNRLNRSVPVEISVLFIGYTQGDTVHHLLPPRSPLTLDSIYTCSPQEIRAFTAAGRFGYLRHILRAQDLPFDELLASHLQIAAREHEAAGSGAWTGNIAHELITLLRDDYPALMSVLGALADTGVNFRAQEG